MQEITKKARPWLTEDGLAQVYIWATLGLSDEQIANNMKIHRRTFYKWKEAYPEFSKALEEGKKPVDLMVENSLLKSALGYSEKQVEECYRKNESGELELFEKKIKTNPVSPSVRAMEVWLRNRQPDKWRNNQKEWLEKVRAETVLVEMEIRQKEIEIEQLELENQPKQVRVIDVSDGWGVNLNEEDEQEK